MAFPTDEDRDACAAFLLYLNPKLAGAVAYAQGCAAAFDAMEQDPDATELDKAIAAWASYAADTMLGQVAEAYQDHPDYRAWMTP